MTIKQWVSALAVSITGMSSLSVQGLTVEEITADIALAQEAFERIHPGYERYTEASDLTDAWHAITTEARANGGMSVEKLYLRVQGVLARIRCDHTKAQLPSAMEKARLTDPVYLPLRYVLIDGRALVVAAAPDLGVAVNDEILAIDGEPMATLIARYEPLIPVDGYTDFVREDELADSREFPGGGIEHFMALEGVAPMATLELSDASGATRTVTVERVGLSAQRELAAHLDGASNFKDAVALNLRDDGTAVLRVDSFVNYRSPVDPDDVYAPLFRAIQEADVSHLIVDLRANGGGSNDARDRLFAYLISEPSALLRESYVRTLDLEGVREHVTTWEKRALNPSRLWFKRIDDKHYRLRRWMLGMKSTIRPARGAWTGKLTVLTSTANSSGSTMLIGGLQNQGRAHVLGERTGGNLAGPTAGTLFFLKLPSSEIVLRLPVLRSVTGFDPEDRGQGVVPDTLVAPTFDDRRAGRDPILERALAR